ncbi:MAG TPA: hypothetical protein ENN09_01240 [Planctomycetes bacterium]|nr:hypothetical protein [Planctomycetota bacterium]
MPGDVILPDTRAEEWPGIRAAILRRITDTLGSPGAGCPLPAGEFSEIERCEKHGLVHVRFRYHVIGEEYNYGTLVLPSGGQPERPVPCILALHGTNGKEGKDGVLDPENKPTCAYAVELARRGYVAAAADQYGFGESVPDVRREAYTAAFYEKYPDWSIDGRRLLGHTRLLDALSLLPFIDGGAFGAIGNSTGGRGTVFLAALDERIKAAVGSTAVSPNATNVFRYLAHDYGLCPRLHDEIKRSGCPPWDYHEMLALIAPRAFLSLEPFNDAEGCNPDVFPVMQCLYAAARVWRLLGSDERIAWYVHGDGHRTIGDVREFAYRWFDRFLKG